jgi:hypothetical protein
MRKPSPAMIVALLSLFVALGGVAVAANGGSFILGQPNSATANTSLSAPVAGGKTLQLTNNDTSNAASTALGLNVASGHAPFTVSSKVKVTNLNADLLDGLDSTAFLPKDGTAANSAKLGGQLPSYYLQTTGKAADSDKLDGIDSTGYTQGGGRFYITHHEGVPGGTSGTLLDLPDVGTLTYHCHTNVSSPPNVYVALASDDLYLVWDNTFGHVDSSYPYNFLPGAYDTFTVHFLGSRPFNRTTFRKGVFVDVRFSAAWLSSTDKCVVEAIAQVFNF